MSNQKLIPVPGSLRAPLPGARAIGPADPQARIEVTVLVRPSQALAAPDALSASLPNQRRYMSRKEFEQTHGAAPEDLAKVEAFAHDHHLDVVEVNLAGRTIRLSGTIADFSAAFGVELQQYLYEGGTYRGRTGHVNVPADLDGIVVGVFGLDDRPVARPHFRRLPTDGGPIFTANVTSSFKPTQIARLYDFPSTATGAGQCIAIIELGGGYRASDLRAYFAGLGIHKPRITAVSVAGGHNRPTGDPNGADG
ncbi:MAG TPA: protease pro-enzyme activation domain-containing protein, partial [Roseiflexaceae bacterium]|nr:protease pro-enzyme activation domain-containing protein [Roseiflexaceae bacterium]